jgi:hypothetical protein
MTSARTAKTAQPTSNVFEVEQPLAVTLRPFIVEALPRLRRIGALPDAALSGPRSPLAPLGRDYRDPAYYRYLARALTHLVREDTRWQRASVLARTYLIVDFLQVAGAFFEITDAQSATA